MKSFEEKYQELDTTMMDFLEGIRQDNFMAGKAMKLKEGLIDLYKDTVKTEEGRKVTKLAEMTSIIMEELNGFVCDTDDADSAVVADNIHNDIGYALEQIASGNEDEI